MTERNFQEIADEVLEWWSDALHYLRDNLDIRDPDLLATAMETIAKTRMQWSTKMREDPDYWLPCDGCGAEWHFTLMGMPTRACAEDCIVSEMLFAPVMNVRKMEL